MSFFKTAFLELKGRKATSVILFLILLIQFMGVLAALTLQYSAQNSKVFLLENIGASVTLDYADVSKTGESLFIDDIIDQLINIENVVGVNQNYADFALPQNFENNKSFLGQNPYSQKVQITHDAGFEDNIVIEGNIRTDLIDLFRNNAAKIITGEYPTKQQPGALISKELADQNKLKLYDNIAVLAYDNEYTIPIVGIYETIAQFQITSDNIIGAAVFAHSPYNRIYVDIDSCTKLFNIERTTLPISICIDSPNNVQRTGEKIKSMNFNWTDFRLINTTATEYRMLATNIESISYLTELFVVFFTLFTSAILIIVMSIRAQTFQYESGIYLSLGTSKWRAIALFLFDIIYVALPALFIAVLSCKPIASLILNYQENASATITTAVQQFTTGTETNANIIVTQPDMTVFVLFFATVIWSILLACMLPAYAVLKLKPREILTRK